MSAEPTGSWERELQEYCQQVPPTAGWRDAAQCELVQRDLQGVGQQVWKASRRRAPPWGAAP
eukprot:10331793-Lingulodinium_polyedra.AAC.1